MAKIPFKPPDLSNATPSSIVDELGKVKGALSVLKKLEKFYVTALKARAEGKEVIGESYTGSVSMVPREALDQSKAKEYFEAKGMLPDFMTSGLVETLHVNSRDGGKPVTQKEMLDVVEYVLSAGEIKD